MEHNQACSRNFSDGDFRTKRGGVVPRQRTESWKSVGKKEIRARRRDGKRDGEMEGFKLVRRRLFENL